jgi:S1-C subfamily serine protease
MPKIFSGLSGMSPLYWESVKTDYALSDLDLHPRSEHMPSATFSQPIFVKKVAGLALVSLFSIFASAHPSAAQDDVSDVISKSEQSVVGIVVKTAKGEALGSGFLVKSSGILVTNVHVMAEATSAECVFEDGRKVSIKGTYYFDPARDICIAQVDGDGFQPISIASSLPRKGEQVIALGCPQGLTFSATRGIVSAIRQQEEFRQMVGRPKMEGTWIQIDAAISGGNSGGPLINARGEVVGMSTLASTGNAQNLNFGISNQDISEAIAKADNAPLINLQSGIGRVDMAEHRPDSKRSLIQKGEIPKAALEDYIARGRREYKELVKDLRKEASEAKKKLETMRKGESRIPANTNASVVVQIHRDVEKYFFRDESTKRTEVSRQQSYVSSLDQIVKQIPVQSKSDPDDEAMMALLFHAGPWLDPRNVNKIGFMRGAVSLTAFNEHEAVVSFNETPFLMWMDSTAGLSEGETIKPAPVFVVGTQTLKFPDGRQQAVTVLSTVTEKELRAAIFGETKLANSEFRTWTDTTGKFSIDAKLVEISGSEVVLEGRDGKRKPVPIGKLSKEDLRFLGK